MDCVVSQPVRSLQGISNLAENVRDFRALWAPACLCGQKQRSSPPVFGEFGWQSPVANFQYPNSVKGDLVGAHGDRFDIMLELKAKMLSCRPQPALFAQRKPAEWHREVALPRGRDRR
jgi:hypothetical protein